MRKAITGYFCSVLLLLAVGCTTLPPDTIATPAAPLVSTDLIAHFINVGQGNCVLIQCPGAMKLVLDDCGTVASSGALSKQQVHDYIDSLLKAYVSAANKTPLAVFVSHPDRDHVNLISDPTYGVDTTKVSAVYHGEDLTDYNQAFQTWANKVPVSQGFNRPDSRQNFFNCGAAVVDVMTVNSNPRVSDPNADSLVFRIRYAGRSIIIPGDADGDTQEQVVANYPGGFQPTILAGSHHGADTFDSNDATWAAASNPPVVIFLAGFHNGYRHPRCTSVDSYMNNSPALSAWAAHSFNCGADATNTWSVRNPSKAIFTTAQNGTIDATISAGGAVTLSCSKGC